VVIEDEEADGHGESEGGAYRCGHLAPGPRHDKQEGERDRQRTRRVAARECLRHWVPEERVVGARVEARVLEGELQQLHDDCDSGDLGDCEKSTPRAAQPEGEQRRERGPADLGEGADKALDGEGEIVGEGAGGRANRKQRVLVPPRERIDPVGEDEHDGEPGSAGEEARYRVPPRRFECCRHTILSIVLPIDDHTWISLSRRQWILLTGVATVAFWIALGIIERSLPSGTPGIIEFEFVRNAHRAARFLAEWGADGRATVRLSLIVDYGFMVSYGAFVTLAGLATRDFGREHGLRALASAGRLVPWFAAAAAVFDAVENAFLLLTVGGDGGSAAPVLATVCASVKWVLIVVAVGYLVWGLGARLLTLKGRPRQDAA
jgi:hypothetical protein